MRQLSAIMFTDMVGFTALMQDDEHRAKSIRDRHRDTLRQSIEKHGGEIIQFYGDGTLSVFGSAVDAVSSAVAAQQALQQEPSIPVRIGLHIGDIIRDEDGVYGDGVNVAARIEGLSVPGAVMISGKVFDEIKNHPELPATALGEFDLKNVRRPVRVFRDHGAGARGSRPRVDGRPDRATREDHRRTPLRQHERRSGERVLQRWHFRGAHQRADAGGGPPGHGQNVILRLQGPRTRTFERSEGNSV